MRGRRGTSVPRAAWLSVDKEDNDPDRFWTYVVAALRNIHPDLGRRSLNMLETGKAPSIRAVLTTLINDMSGTTDDFVLVLDDYHEITARSVHESLAFLVDHLPPTAHLVLATRVDPPLPLARLRARGQLSEVRAADLRFTIEEATAFFNDVMDLGLTADNVKALESLTEGWIASIRMAAISMQSCENIPGFIAEFAGTHRHVMDYLVEEVLGRQRPSVQQFLVRTSVLDRFNAPLCNAVTGAENAQEMLDYLQSANLFVVPLDESGRWFRYHHLFSDLLRDRLLRTQPDRIPALHRRASEWFEREGLISEAIHHALAARDLDRAADLIEAVAVPLISQGRISAPQGWLEKLPEDVILSRPWLCIGLANVRSARGQLTAVPPLVEAVESILSGQRPGKAPKDTESERRIRNHLTSLRIPLLLARGETDEAIRLCHESMEQSPEDESTVRCMSVLMLGLAHWMRGDMLKAMSYLEEATIYGQTTGNYFITLVAMGHLADIYVRQGRLHLAAETSRRAIRLGTEWGGGEPLPATSYAHICLAQILYQWNEIEEAIHYVNRAIELGRQGVQLTIAVIAVPGLAPLTELIGQTTALSDALDELEGVAAASRSVIMSRVTAAWRARLALARGNVSEALQWAMSREGSGPDSDEGLEFSLEFEYLMLARLNIVRGQLRGVPAILERLRRRAEAEGRMGSVIEILVLLATTLRAQGRAEEAMAALQRALALAEPEGYVRVFVDAGEPMAELLRSALTRKILPEYVSGLLALFGGAAGRGSPRSFSGPRVKPAMEPITARELEVLRLLAAGASNRQIAEELVLVTGTVKAHLLNIYRKLDVHNRTQAVARARQLNLI
ncbi:MAG: LuxR C-terminal-related transcriptional regulator [Dehalococcoidia bacterium]|nr:LuxR C-terminal-related transcriptional regulator [Dehalococcoidia bacterium]